MTFQSFLQNLESSMFRCRLLSILFSLGALVFLVCHFIKTRQRVHQYIRQDATPEDIDHYTAKAWDKMMMVLLGTLILTFSFITSFHILTTPIQDIRSAWMLVNSSVAFLIVVFIKVLLCSWIIALIAGLMKPDRLSEFAAKFFGFEITQKYAPEQIKAIDQTLDDMQARINMLSILTKETMDYIASSFEGVIVADERPVEKIREVVQYTLQSAYYNYDKVTIYVVPLTEEGIRSLPEHLYPLVKKRADERVDLSIVEKKTVGIGVHYGNEELSTVIVMDGTLRHYEITLPEIYTASNFFIAVSTIATWASMVSDEAVSCEE